MPDKILYNFATRSRVNKFFKCLANITSLARHPSYQIIVTADLDDPTMCNDFVRDKVKAYPNTKIYYGYSKNKLDAVNKNVGLMDEDVTVIINMSDDFEFLIEGFDLQIISDMNKYFPDNDGYLHYPDGSPAKDVLCTMAIMGRVYYNRFSYIYHPDYDNVYADDESTRVAKILKKHQFINKQIAIHKHPVWNLCEWDEQYRRTEEKTGYDKDRQTFARRKKINFDL